MGFVLRSWLCFPERGWLSLGRGSGRDPMVFWGSVVESVIALWWYLALVLSVASTVPGCFGATLTWCMGLVIAGGVACVLPISPLGCGSGIRGVPSGGTVGEGSASCSQQPRHHGSRFEHPQPAREAGSLQPRSRLEPAATNIAPAATVRPLYRLRHRGRHPRPC